MYYWEIETHSCVRQIECMDICTFLTSSVSGISPEISRYPKTNHSGHSLTEFPSLTDFHPPHCNFLCLIWYLCCCSFQLHFIMFLPPERIIGSKSLSSNVFVLDNGQTLWVDWLFSQVVLCNVWCMMYVCKYDECRMKQARCGFWEWKCIRSRVALVSSTSTSN